MRQKIALRVGIAILALGGIAVISEFRTNHTYYDQMLKDSNNRLMIISALACAMMPIGYLMYSKKVQGKYLLASIFGGLTIFGLIQVSLRDGLFGTGLLMFILNTAIIFAVGGYFLAGILALGSRISSRIIGFKQENLQELFLNFGIGLCVFMLVNHLLAISTLFYPIITRIIFIGRGFLIHIQRKTLKSYVDLLLEKAMLIRHAKSNLNFYTVALIVLVVCSLMYYYYGFHLAFIPYPTAWDANHAYMQVPKIWAENHGIIRSQAPISPVLRYSFISFWFSLFQPLKSAFWLSPDTFAVEMNFLSGIFVLLFGLGLINEIIRLFSHSKQSLQVDTEHLTTIKETKDVAFYTGWLGLLLWLTSGMGAFLVFIDNKTDLGVFSLIILGLLSGFIFINEIQQAGKEQKSVDKNLLKYVYISGFLFGCAALAKPTAFLDILNFGLFTSSLRLSLILTLGGAIMVIGLLAKLKLGSISYFISEKSGIRNIVIGLLVSIGGVSHAIKKNTTHLLKYLGYWIIVVFATVLVFKLPHLITNAVITKDYSIGNFFKNILLTTTEGTDNTHSNDTKRTLLASNVSLEGLNQGSCTLQSLGITKEQLFSGLRKSEGSNYDEDVGRYIGFGQREFKNPRWGFLFPIKGCFGRSSSARLLCNNQEAVNRFDYNTLNRLLTQMSPSAENYETLSGILHSPKILAAIDQGSGAFAKLNLQDELRTLNGIIGNQTIKVTSSSVFIPYRSLVPLNIVFNRSLQNLSSYYTDIGFIRRFMMIFVIGALIYALVQKHLELLALSLTSTIGRGIRWLIGGGILWYGIGIIIRTIATVAMLFYVLHKDSKKEAQLFGWFLGLFLFRAFLQIFINFIRISSQGARGQFARYKMTNGKEYVFNQDTNYQGKEAIDSKFTAKDVFDAQFPHYNGFIDHVANRSDADGIMIAGTYLKYFLKNQQNIIDDGMLSSFREWGSDNDICKLYLRLKEKNLKYLVVDPNIGTVAMAGNETLFERFFAKINPTNGAIDDQGALLMMVNLLKQGYAKLWYSNNLGAKYAFMLSDSELNSFAGVQLDPASLLILRAKLSVVRFFANKQPELVNLIKSIFIQRIGNGQGISDIADIFGKTVNGAKLQQNAAEFMSATNKQEALQKMSEMTQDERIIYVQYLNALQSLNSNTEDAKKRFADFIDRMLGQSLGGSSQLIILELL